MTGRARLWALLTIAAVAVLACSTEGDRTTTAIGELGFTDASVVTTDVAGNVTVSVTARSGPDDPTAANAVARAVWELHPVRVDEVVVSAPGSSNTFGRSQLEDMFGPRDPSLDANRPAGSRAGSGVPSWVLPLCGALALGAAVALAGRRLARRPVVDGPGGLASEHGLVFAQSRATGLSGTAASKGDVTVDDVLDVLALLAESPVSADAVLLAGRWAVRAAAGDGPDALPVLDLLVAQESLGEAVRELGSVGFEAEWGRRLDTRRMVLRDHRGRTIRVSAMRVVDGAADGPHEDGEVLDVPTSRIGFGRLGGVQVPCLLPESAPVA